MSTITIKGMDAQHNVLATTTAELPEAVPDSFIRDEYNDGAGTVTRFTHGFNRNEDNYHWFSAYGGNGPITIYGGTELNGYMKFRLEHIVHEYDNSNYVGAFNIPVGQPGANVAAADFPSGAIYVNGTNVGTASTINKLTEYTVNDIQVSFGGGQGSHNEIRYLRGVNFQRIYSPSIDIPQTTFRTLNRPSNEAYDDTPPPDIITVRFGMVAIRVLEIGYNNL
tara:strand:- start:1002 stop:1670 length:669 start_codon:yes stop_codon:yes gene_type:complete